MRIVDYLCICDDPSPNGQSFNQLKPISTLNKRDMKSLPVGTSSSLPIYNNGMILHNQ